MTKTLPAAVLGGQNPLLSRDQALLSGVISAVRATGQVLLGRYSSMPPHFSTLDDLLAAIGANDAAALGVLRPALTRLRPQARWVEDEEEGGSLPPGEWWVADPVEGNVNHIHGLCDWGVSATLVRDNVPVLAAVYQPLLDSVFTAVQGGGAFQDGTRLHASPKTALEAALVGTAQARPNEDIQTLEQMARTVSAMLQRALALRVLVPSTMQLVQVAAGRLDLFWQHSQVRGGLLAGALLVAEAGGAVTDIHGAPWTLGSTDLLASASGLSDQAALVLSRTP